mgnify:CR=1 FL=1
MAANIGDWPKTNGSKYGLGIAYCCLISAEFSVCVGVIVVVSFLLRSGAFACRMDAKSAAVSRLSQL